MQLALNCMGTETLNANSDGIKPFLAEMADPKNLASSSGPEMREQ
jgi:hypothetical protein